MISIPDDKLGLRNNQLTIIETKNNSQQNLRMRLEKFEPSQQSIGDNHRF
jgi:hypothetical protein